VNTLQKALLTVCLAVVAGLLLYFVVPEMSEGVYQARVVISDEVIDSFSFTIGSNSTKILREGNFTYCNSLYHYTLEVPAVKSIKLNQYFAITANITLVNGTGCGPLNIKLYITLPAGHTLSYTPQQQAQGTYRFNVRVLYKTKIAAFIMASSIVLFIGASIIPFIITSIYLTLALYLTGSISLTEPFTLYMSDTCLVFLAGSAFEIVLLNTGLAERIANVLKFMARSPFKLFLGTFLVGGFISMWMSNTSATYLLLPVVVSITTMAGIENTRLAELTLIGLAAGTTAGGMATIVGTPPNLIVSGFINANIYGGESVVNFYKWLAWGLPIFLVAVVAAVLSFTICYRAAGGEEYEVVSKRLHNLALSAKQKKPWSRSEVLGLVGVLVLIGLWLTEPIHGIKTGVAGMMGLLLFLALGVMKPKHLRELGWDIVVLMGGGLTLGRGLMETGFSDYLSQLFQPFIGNAFTAIITVSLISYVIGTIISSHTAATAFIVPVVAPLGSILAPALGVSMRAGSAIVALTATTALNYAIALPISTPPSAIVFGTGKVRVKMLVVYGLLWGLLGLLPSTLIMLNIAPLLIK